MLNLPKSPTKFHVIAKSIFNSLETVADSSMKEAAVESIKENNDNNIAIAVDGSWQKRGHTSHNGFVAWL